MEGAVFTGNPLGDDFGIRVDPDGHEVGFL
jgi:hypothetical protein